MATAPPTTASLSRGWCGQPNASPGGTLPALQDFYSTLCHRKAKKVIKGLSHPSHDLFTPLPSGRQKDSTGVSKLGPRDWKTASLTRPLDCYIVTAQSCPGRSHCN
jgi:hypothetical protein